MPRFHCIARCVKIAVPMALALSATGEGRAEGSLANQFDPNTGGTITLPDEPLSGNVNATFMPGVIGVPQPTGGRTSAAVQTDIDYVNAQIDQLLAQLRVATTPEQTEALKRQLLGLTAQLIDLEAERDALRASGN